jgi:hypothetical protein
MTLPKDTIDTIVLLAELDTRAGVAKLIEYVESLSLDQKAELMALMWLGRDAGQYGQHLPHARTLTNDTVGLYLSEQRAMLSKYLRQGVQSLGNLK